MKRNPQVLQLLFKWLSIPTEEQHAVSPQEEIETAGKPQFLASRNSLTDDMELAGSIWIKSNQLLAWQQGFFKSRSIPGSYYTLLVLKYHNPHKVHRPTPY